MLKPICRHVSSHGKSRMAADDRAFDPKQEKDIARFVGKTFKIALTFGNDHISFVKVATEFGAAIVENGARRV